MWTLYIFTAMSKPLPKYVLVFVNEEGHKAHDLFKKEIGEDPVLNGDYSFSTGVSQQDALDGVRKSGIITGYYDLNTILALPECKVIKNKYIKGITKLELTTSSSNGMVCSRCGQHNPYAESNQSDGSYICYNCRS